MTEYIHRDMAIARLTKVEVTEKIPTMAHAKRAIADMPAADVVPVWELRELMMWLYEKRYLAATGAVLINGLIRNCRRRRAEEWMTDTKKVVLCKALLRNYDTDADPDSVSALETLVRNIEAVMNFEEDKNATDRC